MVTTLEFADAIGRKKMAEALGVLPTAVSNAVVRGRFPSSWFMILSDLASEAGLECSPDLFGMRLRDGADGEASLDTVVQGPVSDSASLEGAS